MKLKPKVGMAMRSGSSSAETTLSCINTEFKRRTAY